MARRTAVSIGGRRVVFTNLDKVLYPQTGTTKAEVLEYYTLAAPLLIAHARGRPVTLRRWVDGVGTEADPEAGFFQKDIAISAPDWVRRFSIKHSDHTNEYPLVNDVATLAWLVQLAALEVHTPQWRFGPRGGRRHPDRLVIDLDPGEGADLAHCAAVARIVRERLRAEGLEAFPVTSGSKGIHLYAALDGSRPFEAVSEFAHQLARGIEADHGDLVVSDMAKRLRAGKVLIDWSQNNGSKTTIAPYSLRGRLRPTVAAPRTWREIASPTLRHLEYTEVMSRIRAGRGDPLRALTEPDGPAPHDDEDEDVDQGTRAGRPTFVIQEHQARRLHFDLRLQKDGVLVSWRLPTGVPLDPRRDHLAIHTEDHPLDNAGFEGAIPEYRGGSIRIWDSGTFDLLKWREGEEVVARLHGRHTGGLGGDRTFALTHTGRPGADDDHWLIHAMDEPSVRWAGSAPAPMLAASAPSGQPAGAGWGYEMKWDGIRALCEVRAGQTRVWSRNGNDITGAFPELTADLPASLRGEAAVVDGEIIALDARGRPSFERLQERLGVSTPTNSLVARTPSHLMLFDVLAARGETTTDRPYRDRRELLESMVVETPRIHVPPSYETDLDTALSISRENGLEGVVAKRVDSLYCAGMRSAMWLKVKHTLHQEVIVVGWVESTAGDLASLVVAVPSADAGLRYAGRVGTGFAARERSELLTALRPLTRASASVPDAPDEPGLRVHWVEPSLVGEVRLTEWTTAGRMRHPAWRGLRHDKDPSEVVAPEAS